MALAYLFAPSSQTYTCPLAMTDGCARTLEFAGESPLSRQVLPRLISRDPEKAWTSGQWMTERTGGSDVGLSETVARRQADGSYRLYGTKWFTSAIASEVALTLGRPEGNGLGGKGLALFFVRVRDERGYPNDLTVLRLKDKLGTPHLPTAELLLDGTVAHTLFGDRDGVRHMATMLNVTRTWNAVCSVAGMQRAIALARDYARRRARRSMGAGNRRGEPRIVGGRGSLVRPDRVPRPGARRLGWSLPSHHFHQCDARATVSSHNDG